MKRIHLHRLLLAVAMLHLAIDGVFSGGAVLCIGPDEHRAVEWEHPVELFCSAGESARSPKVDSLAAIAAGHASSTRCTDLQLHGHGELVSAALHGADVHEPSPLLHASPPPTRDAPIRCLPRPPTAAQLGVRTVVLIV